MKHFGFDNKKHASKEGPNLLNLRTSALNTFGFDDERDVAKNSSRNNQTWFHTWVRLKPISLKKLPFKTELTTSIILSRLFIRNDNSSCMATFKKSSVTGLGKIYKILFRKISIQTRFKKRKRKTCSMFLWSWHHFFPMYSLKPGWHQTLTDWTKFWCHAGLSEYIGKKWCQLQPGRHQTLTDWTKFCVSSADENAASQCSHCCGLCWIRCKCKILHFHLDRQYENITQS